MSLREVKEYMEFWGWDRGGECGSFKRDDTGQPIARHGDITWIADVDKACETIKRLASKAEKETGE